MKNRVVPVYVQKHGYRDFADTPLLTSATVRDPRYDRSSLRVLGCVGEPLNTEAWHWYNDLVGEKRCDVIDTWWQTGETAVVTTAAR